MSKRHLLQVVDSVIMCQTGWHVLILSGFRFALFIVAVGWGSLLHTLRTDDISYMHVCKLYFLS
jgi:hypothetical protein